MSFDPDPDPASVASILDSRYSQLSGRQKRDYLFDAGIRATAYGDALPDVQHDVLQFAESAIRSYAEHLLSQTLTRESDELDPPKHKLFHTHGTVAEVVFEPVPTQRRYTGLLAATVHGLARFSYAGPVVGVGIVPGLGLKFPVDGDHPSVNIVVMRMLDGQTQHSVFEHPFTNILPNPGFTNLVMQEVKKRFETVVLEGRGLHQPVDNLAGVEPNGMRVAGEAHAPYRLILVPTSTARDQSDSQLDFRVDLARNCPAGTVIYDVRALDEDVERARSEQGAYELDDLIGGSESIGTLRTESEFIASSYGDYRLFFKHNATFARPSVRAD